MYVCFRPQFQTDKLVEEARAKFEKLFLTHTDMSKKVQSDSSCVVFWIALGVFMYYPCVNISFCIVYFLTGECYSRSTSASFFMSSAALAVRI